MKIYVASGFSVMNVRGREKNIHKKIKGVRRLVSFHFKDLILKSEILTISGKTTKKIK